MRIAAAGLTSFSGFSVLRTGMIMLPDVPVQLSRTTTMLIGWSLWTFIFGVCLAGATARVAAVRVWFRHRHIYHQLRPLWSLLHSVFPADALEHSRTPLAKPPVTTTNAPALLASRGRVPGWTRAVVAASSRCRLGFRPSGQ